MTDILQAGAALAAMGGAFVCMLTLYTRWPWRDRCVFCFITAMLIGFFVAALLGVARSIAPPGPVSFKQTPSPGI